MEIADLKTAFNSDQLKELSHSTIGLLMRCAAPLRLKPGTTLYQQGEQANLDLLLVIQGTFEITRDDRPGEVIESGPGTFLGEIGSMISRDQRRTRTVVTPTGASLLKFSMIELQTTGGADWPPLQQFLETLAHDRLNS